MVSTFNRPPAPPIPPSTEPAKKKATRGRTVTHVQLPEGTPDPEALEKVLNPQLHLEVHSKLRDSIPVGVVHTFSQATLPENTAYAEGPSDVTVTTFSHQHALMGPIEFGDLVRSIFVPLAQATKDDKMPPYINTEALNKFCDLVKDLLAPLSNIDTPKKTSYWAGSVGAIFSSSAHTALMKAMLVSKLLNWANCAESFSPLGPVCFDRVQIQGVVFRHITDQVWTLTVSFFESAQTSNETHAHFARLPSQGFSPNHGGSPVVQRRIFETIIPVKFG